MSPQCLNCAWMSALVMLSHAALILPLMFLSVSGPSASTRCRHTLNKELSRGLRRLADAGGMRMTSTSSWHPQSWNSCCSLFATRRSSICFFLAVALQRAEGQLRASGCLHLWQKLRVTHSSGCAIAVADGGCNVTAYLRCTECTCPACALLALQ
jgi:hypothetical protein